MLKHPSFSSRLPYEMKDDVYSPNGNTVTPSPGNPLCLSHNKLLKLRKYSVIACFLS